jgi:hypothetical protein
MSGGIGWITEGREVENYLDHLDLKQANRRTGCLHQISAALRR